MRLSPNPSDRVRLNDSENMIAAAREIAYRLWRNVHHPLHKTPQRVCRIEMGQRSRCD